LWELLVLLVLLGVVLRFVLYLGLVFLMLGLEAYWEVAVLVVELHLFVLDFAIFYMQHLIYFCPNMHSLLYRL
jgi:hypothetical protein